MEGKRILKGRFSYFLSKVAPKNVNVTIALRNGLKFIVRARTMDKSVLKEVWINKIYDRFGVNVEKGDTVIDIGGHIGIFSVYASSISATGKVYAFEPFEENFKRLEEHKKLNNQKNLFVFHCGVSAVDGTQTLYLSPDNNTGGHSLHLKTHSENKVQVKTVRLSEFCQREKIEKIDFLKLDCEGAEFEIILSDPSILQKVRKIIMECHPYGNHTVDEMTALLKNSGFQINGVYGDDPTGVRMVYACRK